MISERKVLAIVPARGGSKGIPKKNLKKVGGRSLVSLVGEVISKVPQIDRAVISTDDEEIAEEAECHGISASFRRPEELSGDSISDLEVLVDALYRTEKIDGSMYDVIVMLQPTAPFRKAEQVEECLKILIKDSLDSVWTLTPTDSKSHPLKQLSLNESKLVNYYDPAGEKIIARQQLEPVYHRNGVAYAFTRDCLLNQKTIIGSRTGTHIIDGLSVNIDTQFDLDFAEYLIKSGKFNA